MTRITVTVDGVGYPDEVEPRTLLVHSLRERLGPAPSSVATPATAAPAPCTWTGRA